MLPTVKGDNQNHLSMCFQTIFWPVGKKKCTFDRSTFCVGQTSSKLKHLGCSVQKAFASLMRSKTAFKLAADTSSMAVQGMKVRLFCLLGYPKKSRNTPQMVHCFFVKHLRSSPKIIAYSSNGSMSRRKNAVILGSAIRYPTGCQQTQKPQHNLGKIALRHNLQITLTCGLAFCVRNQKIIGLWCLGLIGSFLK